MEILTIKAQEEDAGQRLDKVLAARAPALSRARLQALIESGQVLRADMPITNSAAKVKVDDVFTITVPPPEDATPRAQDIALDIVYEDDDLLVVNKAVGMVVHPAIGNHDGTMVNALLAHCGDSLSGIGGVRRPGIVHRLDKDTSGVMVVAKTDAAHRALSQAFADHGADGELERAYLALVWGAPERDGGKIDAPLGRSPKDRTRQAVVRETQTDARHAVTHYRVRERYGRDGSGPLASLVECQLETGRTHQIRVHMAHIGHPVIGDPEYGAAFRTKANRLPEPARSLAAGFPRQALHAAVLGFVHPVSGQPMRFETSPPNDMARLAKALVAA